MPVMFAERLDRQLAAGLGVSTAVLANHLNEFLETATPGRIAQFCDAQGTPATGWCRPICIPRATFQGLEVVSRICGQPMSEVITILLASNPQDVYDL